MKLVTDAPSRETVRAVKRKPGLSFPTLPYLLLLPSIILIFTIELYPFITGTSYSLHKGTLLNTGAFIGLDNYVHLFNSADFYHSLYFSFVFAFFNVLFSYLIGLALALFLNLDFPGRGFCRVALLIPWIVPAIVSIVSWKWLIADRGGLVNIMLQALGIGPIYFLSESGWAMVAVTVIKIWRSFPFMMLTLLAALQVIDRNLYEAAKLDGANSWRLFWHITLPHLRNISIVQAILMVIWSIWTFLLNSGIVALGSTVLGIVLAALAGFSMSRFRAPLLGSYNRALLIVQMFPLILAIIPLFIFFRKLDMVNNSVPVILVYTVTQLPFSTWMLRSYFDSIPRDLDEAAKVDGCSPLRCFVQVILPLASPGIAAVAIFSFLFSYNEFFISSVFLRDENRMTIPVGIQSFMQQYSTDWGSLMASATLAMVPTLILFLFIQKYLISGALAGAVKG